MVFQLLSLKYATLSTKFTHNQKTEKAGTLWICPGVSAFIFLTFHNFYYIINLSWGTYTPAGANQYYLYADSVRQKGDLMYESIIASVVIITIFFMAKAIIGNWFPTLAIFTSRACVCVVLGTILGCLIATPLFGVDRRLGFCGIGVGIAVAWLLSYGGLVARLIQLIPANIRHIFSIIFNVIRIVLIMLAIVGVIWGVLTIVGI